MDNKKKLVGKSSAIDPPKYEGLCLTFYKSGKKESIYNYKDGQKAGTQYEFFPNGNIYRTLDYRDSTDLLNDFTDNYLITANYDSLGTTLVENGNGYYKNYDPSSEGLKEEGKVVNGKKDSVWKGSSKSPSLTFVETHENGMMKTGYAIYKNGETKSYDSRKIAPQFIGGVDVFYKYLSDNIEYPDYEKRKGVQGKVIISFVVEKDGRIADVKVMESVSPGLDKEAKIIISKSPKWLPGRMFGEPVRVFYDVPISFSLN